MLMMPFRPSTRLHKNYQTEYHETEQTCGAEGTGKKLEILVLSLSFFKTSDAIIFYKLWREGKKIKCIFSKKNKVFPIAQSEF